MDDNIICFSEQELTLLGSFNQDKTQVNFNECIFYKQIIFPIALESKALIICQKISKNNQITLLVKNQDEVSLWLEKSTVFPDLTNIDSDQDFSQYKIQNTETRKQIRKYRGQNYEVSLAHNSTVYNSSVPQALDSDSSHIIFRKYRGQIYAIEIAEKSVPIPNKVKPDKTKLLKYRGQYIDQD